MEPTIEQPNSNPTRKLTAATVAAAFWAFAGLVVRNLWPDWYDPEVWAAASPIVLFAAGWFIRDRPNVPEKERADA